MYIPQDTTALFAGKSFLVIDDFQGMRALLREMLKIFGSRNIDTVTNGKEAIAFLEKNKYDVVLCDYNLGGGKTGQHVLEEAKHRDLIGLATAWIIITAEKTADLVFGAAEYMPDDYIIKPVNEATMKSRLEKVLTRKAMLIDIEKAVRDKDYDRTVALCDKALASSKTNTTELQRIKTGTLLTMGRYGRARQEFEQILAKRDIPWARTGLGKAYFYNGDLARAQQLFREVINANPAYLEAHDWLAKSHEKAGELEEAQRALARCTELSPNSVVRQRSLGELAQKRGDLETAETAFRKTIKLGEFSIHKTPVAYLGLAKIRSENDDPAEALQILKEINKEFNSAETNLHAKVVEGMVYSKSGDLASAGRISREVAELAKADDGHLTTGIMLEAAQLFLATGNKEAAEDIAQSIVKNNHENTELLAQVSDLYSQAGMSDQGEELVKKSCQEVIAINDRGVVLAKEGKLDEAIRLLNDAHAMLPNNKRVMINLANMAVMSMRQNGRNSDLMQIAAECLKQVAKLEPQEKWCEQLQLALDALPG
ncbi:tetratricopeptide repeat protein [Candidatus Ferrigenium straubiae]|jgi:tetratricopeptide (TPR) repeat protein|uniref:tetratricopeptide repeat protein n=1 Tax=Candidatus Ferrigenium straubiae TaxID=2919506 RepID=UPI003F4AF186